MIKARNLTVVAIVAGLLASTAVAAPEAPKEGGKSISRAEMLERAEARFAKADKDGDGFLSVEERRENKPKKGAKKRGGADGAETGDDGKAKKPKREIKPISRAEFLEKAEQRFDAADKDGDGHLTPDERKAAKKADRKKVKEKRAAQG